MSSHTCGLHQCKRQDQMTVVNDVGKDKDKDREQQRVAGCMERY